jgi:hypothetical protein
MPQTAGILAVPLGYTKITNITPSDTVPVPAGTKAIMVEGTGNLSVMMPGAASPFNMAAVPAYQVIPISPRLVRASGTTATNIVAMG